jgi:NADH-quinone oxidoreductase subunit E
MLMTWLSTELMDKVAEIIQVLPMGMRWYLLHYVQSKPVGKYLNFCQTSPSTERRTMDYTCEKLGVQLDSRWTFVKVECLGACGCQ